MASASCVSFLLDINIDLTIRACAETLKVLNARTARWRPRVGALPYHGIRSQELEIGHRAKARMLIAAAD